MRQRQTSALHIHHITLLIGSCLIAIMASLLCASGVLAARHAANDPITITEQNSLVSFPKSIDFRASAFDSAAPITQAKIFLTYELDGYQEQHAVAVAHPALSVTISWHETITDNNFIPPGTALTYYWELHDSQGNIHTEAPRRLAITDTRFQWQQLTQGLLHIHWYNRPLTFGQMVLEQASTSIKEIGHNLGGGLRNTVNLWIYQTSEDFQGSLAPHTNEWVGGIAFPDLNQASITIETPEDDTLKRDLPHELTHLLFHQIVGNNVRAPTWFEEGLAVTNQRFQEPDMSRRFQEAIATKSLIRLSDLEQDFPADASKAYLAYGESWKIVSYMYRTFGVDKMALLIKNISQPPMNFDQDLEHSIGMDQVHLENQWRLSLHQPAVLTPTAPAQATPQGQQPASTNPALLLLLMVSVLFVILPLVGAGGYFVYQARRRRIQVQHPAASYGATPPYFFPPAYPNTPGQHGRPAYPLPPIQQAHPPFVPQTGQPPRPFEPPRHQWGPTYPQQSGQPQAPVYRAGQEYSNYHPKRQAPQE